MRTWQLAWTAAGQVQVEQALQLQSGHVLVVVRDSSGYRHILRSTDTAGSAFSVTPSLSMPADAWVMASESWVQMGSAVYVGEYGSSHTATRHLWKSTDDGVSFSSVFSITNVHHFHNVEADPYVPNRLWVTIGDSKTEAHIGYSDDGGHSFTWITQGEYPQSRAVGLMFTKDAVYWATDTPDVPSELDRWDRASGQITTILSHLVGSYRLAIPSGNVLGAFSAIEDRTRDGYIGDNRIHLASSGDGGATWKASDTPWVHDPSNSDSHSVPAAITTADASNRIWIAYTNLAGGVNYISNFELQLGTPTALPVDSFTGATVVNRMAAVRGTTAPVRISCPSGTYKGCSGVVRLLVKLRGAGGRQVTVGGGHHRFSAAPGKTVTVRIHLSRRLMRLLAGHGGVRARAVVTATDGFNLKRATSAVVRLRRARRH